MTRPSSETKEAEHPPRLTTAPRISDVGCESAAGSISRPTDLSVAACSGSCSGIHIPPGFSNAVFGAFGAFSTGLAALAFAVTAGGGGSGGGGVTGGASGPQAETAAARATRERADRCDRVRAMRTLLASDGARENGSC